MNISKTANTSKVQEKAQIKVNNVTLFPSKRLRKLIIDILLFHFRRLSNTATLTLSSNVFNASCNTK